MFSLKKERDYDLGDRMELEDGALGETHHGSTYRRGIRDSPGHGDRKYRAGGQGLGATGEPKGCGGRSPCAAGVPVREDENILEVGGGGGCPTV